MTISTVTATAQHITTSAIITNDATILGMVAIILGAVFYTSQLKQGFWCKFYRVVPALLLCYFLPSLLNTFDIIDGEKSQLYFFTSRYLLPACLVLLTLSVDFKAIKNLGIKAIILFFTGTLGIVVGAPIALLTVASVFPELLNNHGPDAVWKGMTTVAGSWIGGSANQAAMKEVYGVGDNIFSVMVTIDVIVANIWMAVLLVLAAKSKSLDEKSGADTEAIEALKTKMLTLEKQHSRIPSLSDLMMILMFGLGVMGLAHFFADNLTPFFIEHFPQTAKFSFHSHFFWLMVCATTMGLLLSFTPARRLEGVGASKIGSVFLYFLVASIGMKMDVTMILDTPLYFLIGFIWMLIHASLMLLVAKWIKAPLFYMAVASQANVGGAASAPIVASAFHPSLAPVGVLLAVLGYTVGTYMAWFCGQILQAIL